MDDPDPEHSKSLNSLKDKFVLAGRSVYYGALLYAGDIFSQLWLSVLLQAAAVVLAVALTLISTIGFSWVALAVIMTWLAVATPMAFYASLLMPGIFTGLVILGAANLLGLRRENEASGIACLDWLTFCGGSIPYCASNAFAGYPGSLCPLQSAKTNEGIVERGRGSGLLYHGGRRWRDCFYVWGREPTWDGTGPSPISDGSYDFRWARSRLSQSELPASRFDNVSFREPASTR